MFQFTVSNVRFLVNRLLTKKSRTFWLFVRMKRNRQFENSLLDWVRGKSIVLIRGPDKDSCHRAVVVLCVAASNRGCPGASSGSQL